MSAPLDCCIHMVRGRDGRSGLETCSDCGSTLYEMHAKCCEMCLQVFCKCCLYFHSKERHVRKSRSTRTVDRQEATGVGRSACIDLSV